MVKSGKKAKVERKTKRRVPRPAPNFSEKKKKGYAELRDDLFLEAAKLVAEDPSQRIAIIVTPPASESSNVAMEAFGYPSAEGVVRQFLKDSAPPVPDDDAKKGEEEEEENDEDEDWSKYCWWEDEELLNSKDPVEIIAAMVEMKKLHKQLEAFSRFEESEKGEGSATQDDGKGEGSGTKDDGSKP